MNEEQGISDRGPARSSPRDSLFLMASFFAPDGRSLGRARIRNLSATGLMADCEMPLAAGQKVVLDLRGVGRITGNIAWSRDNKVGWHLTMSSIRSWQESRCRQGLRNNYRII